MDPAAIQGWITVAQVLIAIGVDVTDKIKGMLHHAYPSMSEEEMDAAFDAIVEDDNVRAALAAAASQPKTE